MLFRSQRDIGNILQAKQSILLEAAEVLADDIPKQVTSSAYRTLAWENVYDERLAQAELFFRAALDASRTPTGRAYAYRDLGTFYAAYLDKVEQAREMFQLGVKQLEGGWDPAAQLALADTYGTWSAMEADKGDAAKGRDLLQVADTHQARADAMRAGRGATPAAAGPAPGAPPTDVQRASVIR